MKCGVIYCSEPATYQVEIQGFFKQFMCDRHSSAIADAVKPTHLYGLERLS